MLKNSFLFIGYILPPDEMNDQFSKDGLPRVQTLKHNIALLKALEYKNKNINHYVSTKPISDYPLNPTLFTKNKNHSLKLIDKTIDISEVGFINLSLIKVISKFFGVFFLSTKIIISFRKIKFILIYSTDISYLLNAYLLKLLLKKQVTIFMTDPIQQVSNYDNTIKRYFRKLNYKISKKIILSFDRSIVVSEDLAKEYLPSKPYLVVEGVIDINEIETNILRDDIPDNLIVRSDYPDKSTLVVYAGGLSEQYGIKNLLETMIMLRLKPVILIIYGKGEMENKIKEISKTHPNIDYKGFINPDFIHKVYREADYLINPRPIDREYTKHSFPSKILEYMVSGKPIISTFLPGVSSKYNHHFIKLKDNSAKTIAETILNLIENNSCRIHKYLIEEVSFVKRNDYKSVADLLSSFISDHSIVD